MENQEQGRERTRSDVFFEKLGNGIDKISLQYKLIGFGAVLLAVCVWGTIAKWNFSRASLIVSQLMFLSIPFGIIQNSRLKRLYDTKLFSIAGPIVMGVTGVLVMLPGILGNIIPIGFFKKLWSPETSLFISIPVYGLCLLAAYWLISTTTRKVMEKNGYPMYEIKVTSVILFFMCGWVGALIAWSIILVLVALVLMVALAAAAGGVSGGGSTYSEGETETWTEGYNENGDKVYDSRYD